MNRQTMEQKSVKRALSDAEFRLRPMGEVQLRSIARAMLTITHLGVLVTDLDHTTLACNTEFGRIFRVEASDVPKMGIEELRQHVIPRLADPEGWRKNLEDVYSEPLRDSNDAVELRDPQVWIERHSTPLLDPEGNVMGRLWTFRDMTAEHDRARRREIVQRLSVFHHPDPRVVYQEVIDSVANLYNSTAILSIQEGEAMAFRAVAKPPPGAEKIRGNIVKDSFCQLVLEQGAPVIVQDGRNHPQVCDILPVRLGIVRYLGVPLMDAEGKTIGTLCILDSKHEEILGPEDAEFMAIMGNRVSVELERERLWELRTSEQRESLERQTAELEGTRTVLEAMNLGVGLTELAVDEQDLVTRQESLLQGLLGFTAARLTKGSPRGDLSFARTWQLDNDTYSLELIGPPEEFSVPYLQAHVSAVADQISLTISAFRLQHALREANDRLNEAQHRLVQTEKLSVVGALAATVAHDIRNIMTSVALEAGSEGDPAEILERVRKQVARFSVLSHRLLSYVKPKHVATEATDLNGVIRRAIELLNPQVRVSKIELIVDLDSEIPCVVADPNQVEHLFVNLIVNAMQAVSRAGGSLKIQSRIETGALRFSLKDNGRGIPSEKLDQIFDPFFSSRPDGFGLGLFSCRRIAIEHGWELEAFSVSGEGSEFVLTVPRGDC